MLLAGVEIGEIDVVLLPAGLPPVMRVAVWDFVWDFASASGV